MHRYVNFLIIYVLSVLSISLERGAPQVLSERDAGRSISVMQLISKVPSCYAATNFSAISGGKLISSHRVITCK